MIWHDSWHVTPKHDALAVGRNGQSDERETLENARFLVSNTIGISIDIDNNYLDRHLTDYIDEVPDRRVILRSFKKDKAFQPSLSLLTP